jgi:hypothetical protein
MHQGEAKEEYFKYPELHFSEEKASEEWMKKAREGFEECTCKKKR